MNNYCNFPNFKLNVAGLFTHSDLVISLKKIIFEKYKIDNVISEIYGSPNISWNGGRVIDIEDNFNYESEIKKVVNAGLRPVIIFSNPIITEVMLDDTASNELLQIGIKYNAKLIISNDRLLNYIKAKYKDADIKISLIKVAIDKGCNNLKYYKTLEEEYNSYVIHPDDNLNLDLLKELDKGKFEILLNERCSPNCQNRINHYISLSEEQNDRFLNSEIRPRKNFLDCCTAIPEVKQLSHNNKNISLSLEDTKKLYDSGFYNFKIQGRTDNLYAFFFDILKYVLVKEEFYNFYPLFCFYIEKHLKKIKMSSFD